MSDPTPRDDAPLWAAVQQALDERRDPWADPDLATALAERPELADQLLRLTDRLELLGALEAAGVPRSDSAPTGTAPAPDRALPGDRPRPLALLPALAVAAVVLLALRLVLAGDGSGVDLGARASPDPLARVDAVPTTRPAVRVLGWSLRIEEHRPGLALHRERGPDQQTLTARDHRGAVALTTLRSLR